MLYTYLFIYLKAAIKKILGFNTFINLVKPTFSLVFANKQISYFFPLRRFLSLINFMSINLKLINFMPINFINKQMSYFFSLRCFLSLINFKLINFMSMNFINEQISYFFPLRCFLVPFGTYEISPWKSYFFPLRCFLILFIAF